MEPSLVLQSNLLAHGAKTPEVVSEFVERSTETPRSSDVPESSHGLVALLDGPVVLLQAVVGVIPISPTFRTPRRPNTISSDCPPRS
jgi:hypothetical protein